jgi:hypothetical protein
MLSKVIIRIRVTCCPCLLEAKLATLSRPRPPHMHRCRDSPLMRESPTEMGQEACNKEMGKVKMANRFSADFQIFSYRIPLPIKTKRCLVKGEELSSRSTIFSTLERLEPRSIHRENESQLTTSKEMR